MTKSAKVILPQEDTRKRVLKLAWPAVLEQLLNMSVGLADTYIVGHLGASQLAAVGLSIQATS
ncbi:MAG: MATE family efflux transporter, partial [Chloroflexota bacterium]